MTEWDAVQSARELAWMTERAATLRRQDEVVAIEDFDLALAELRHALAALSAAEADRDTLRARTLAEVYAAWRALDQRWEPLMEEGKQASITAARGVAAAGGGAIVADPDPAP